MDDLKFDGFSFDGCYHHTINFSPFERDLYQRETGNDLPPRIDLNDDGYRAYLLWADEKLEQWYRRLGERLQRVNPEAAIYTWTTNAGRFGHFLTIQPMDANQRLVLLGHSLGGLVVARFAAALSEPNENTPWQRPIDMCVLSSPALALDLSLVQKLLLKTLGKLMPKLALSNGLKPEWLCTEDGKADTQLSAGVAHRVVRDEETLTRRWRMGKEVRDDSADGGSRRSEWWRKALYSLGAHA